MLGLSLNRVNGREIGFPLGKSAVREGAAPSALEALRVPAKQRKHEEEPCNIGNGHGPSLLQPAAADLASGIRPATATPADDPNQIMEPPKPTA